MYGYYQRYYCNDESIRQQLQVGIDNRIVNGGVGKIVQYLYVYAIDFFEAIIGYLYTIDCSNYFGLLWLVYCAVIPMRFYNDTSQLD